LSARVPYSRIEPRGVKPSDIQEVIMGRKLLLSVLVALLVVAIPLVAYSDNRVPVNCTVTLEVTDPGTPFIHRNWVRTTGEKTAGVLDCDVDALDGQLSMKHNSLIRLNPDGSFTGKLRGAFSVETADGTLEGRAKANITGVPIGVASSPPFPPGTPIHMVTDVGTWQLTKGDLKGRGTFTVTLVGIVGLPATSGGLATTEPGSLAGVLKIKGDEHEDHGGHKGHKKDHDHDDDDD
jgi:hypothetical protein